MEAAIFDFDGTLIRQESLALFLAAIAGKRRYLSSVAMASLYASRAGSTLRMQVFREHLFRRTLAGKTQEEAADAAACVFERLDWIDETRRALLRHKEEGRRILVATGSLSVYVPALLEKGGIPFDSMLSTEIIVKDGIITGEMATLSCTWDEKARRVKEWLSENDIKGPLWGYGNMPPDGAMLKLVDHPTVVPV